MKILLIVKKIMNSLGDINVLLNEYVYFGVNSYTELKYEIMSRVCFSGTGIFIETCVEFTTNLSKAV